MAMIFEAMRKIEMMYKFKPFLRISFRLLWTNLINFKKCRQDNCERGEKKRSNLVMKKKTCDFFYVWPCSWISLEKRIIFFIFRFASMKSNKSNKTHLYATHILNWNKKKPGVELNPCDPIRERYSLPHIRSPSLSLLLAHILEFLAFFTLCKHDENEIQTDRSNSHKYIGIGSSKEDRKRAGEHV